MSTTVMPASSRSRQVDSENGERRAVMKAKSRATQLQLRPRNENNAPPGKSMNAPLTTPRKALSKIDANAGSRGGMPLTTSHQKNSLASQSSKKKAERRNGSKSVKTRVSRVPQSDSAVKSSVTDLEDDGFPDIETMSTKTEQDEDDPRLFVPPSYFDNLVAALKSTPPLPMGDSAYSFPTLLSSLKLDSEKPLSPITLRTDLAQLPPLDDPFAEDYLSHIPSTDLPDLSDIL